jgi:hypothetical protein
MSNEVLIDMDNPSALVTVAMLSSLLNKEKREYLDIITPFVLNLLPKKKDEKVNRLIVLDNLKLEYGFEDMPSHVLTSILSRLANRNQGILLKKDHEYFVKKVFDSTKFDENRLKMKELIENVLESLMVYFHTYTSYKNISKEETQKRFIMFLSYYGYSVIKDISFLKSITIHTDQNNYFVARFILEEYKNDTAVFYKLLEIIKGFLVYKSIYFFSTEQKKTMKSKLKGTIVYFDTRLLIHALGYNRDEDKLATRELIRLIYESGGEVKTFSHNKDELAGILTKYARDRDSRNSLSLDYFNVNCYDETDVIRLRDSLSINLERIKIYVVDTPEYGVVDGSDVDNKGFLDLKELKNKLEQNLRNFGKTPKETSIEKDIESISAISRLRGRACPYSIENCKAIFVTTNSIILRTLYDLYSERFSKGEICFAIMEVDLTAVLWLKSFDKQTNLPCLKLLENAYAACCPSQEVMTSFVEKVIQLEREGKISDEEALLLRTQHSVKQDILDLSENNLNKISPELVIKVKERFVNAISKENQTRIDALVEENNKYKQTRAQAYDIAEKESIDESSLFERRLTRASKISFGIIGIVSIVLTVYSCVFTNISLIALSILIVIPSVIGLIDTLKSKFGIVSKYIVRAKQKRFDKLYSQKMKQIDRYYSL